MHNISDSVRGFHSGMPQKFVDLSQTEGSRAAPWADYNIVCWQPGRLMGWHSHPFLQTIHILQGELRVDWGDGWIKVAPGNVHVLPPGFSHRLHTEHGHTQFGLNFGQQRDQRGVLAALVARFVAPVSLAFEMRDDWQAVLAAPLPAGRLDRLGLLHALEGYSLGLLRCLGSRPAETEGQRLQDLLEAHRMRDLPVDTVAARMHMSRATLQRLCHRQFGCGVAHLHERIRLQHAARDLLTTGMSIAECGQAAGYEEPSLFSRAFKRVYRLSPRAWRARKRQTQA
ncbi:MAG: helix-turn-helix domain-containing protein [Chitinivibrionales bacterium]|nr:helix-turn-helix domain-containing protein [Chitinivibrionales bacterium]